MRLIHKIQPENSVDTSPAETDRDAARRSDSRNDNYQELKDRGQRAHEDGRWDDALELFQRAYDRAEKQGDAELVDRAYCNLTLPKIELGQGQGCITRLRQILTRSLNPEIGYLAAYNLGRVYDLAKQSEKGLFHARIAVKRAEQLAREDWRAAAFNLVGNLLLVESRSAEALEAYRAALSLLPEGASKFRGTLFCNMGYCYLLNGELSRCFTLLYKSWRMLRRVGGERAHFPYLRLDLAYAHLEANRPRSALRHARAGLELAREVGDRQSIKNALYLLGESAKLSSDLEQAQQYFQELQSFYPELPVVTDYLMAFDLRGLINLRA